MLYRRMRLRATHIWHLVDQHASHYMGKMSESDFGFDRVQKFGFENSECEPIEISKELRT